MVGWHHQLNGHEFEQSQGDGEGQGSLACCSSWGHKESDTTETQNNNKGHSSSFSSLIPSPLCTEAYRLSHTDRYCWVLHIIHSSTLQLSCSVSLVDFILQISKLNSGKLSGLTKIKRLSLKNKQTTFSVRSGLTGSQVCLVTVFPLPVREETTVEESAIYKINIYLSFFLCQELCIYSFYYPCQIL